MRRYLYLLFGFIALILTYIGILLPGVPAIPFVILALYFFSQSSEVWVRKLEKGTATGRAIRTLYRHISKPWFTWFVASQFVVSMIVSERLFIHRYPASIWWYTGALVIAALVVYLMKFIKPSSF